MLARCWTGKSTTAIPHDACTSIRPVHSVPYLRRAGAHGCMICGCAEEADQVIELVRVPRMWKLKNSATPVTPSGDCTCMSSVSIDGSATVFEVIVLPSSVNKDSNSRTLGLTAGLQTRSRGLVLCRRRSRNPRARSSPSAGSRCATRRYLLRLGSFGRNSSGGRASARRAT